MRKRYSFLAGGSEKRYSPDREGFDNIYPAEKKVHLQFSSTTPLLKVKCKLHLSRFEKNIQQGYLLSVICTNKSSIASHMGNWLKKNWCAAMWGLPYSCFEKNEIDRWLCGKKHVLLLQRTWAYSLTPKTGSSPQLPVIPVPREPAPFFELHSHLCFTHILPPKHTCTYNLKIIKANLKEKQT